MSTTARGEVEEGGIRGGGVGCSRVRGAAAARDVRLSRVRMLRGYSEKGSMACRRRGIETS